MKRVEWRPYHSFSTGWELWVDGVYQGVVDVDGVVFSTKLRINKCFRSQPIAAESLLRAAGVEP